MLQLKSILSSTVAVFSALLASTCCVGPLLALAGLLGVTSSQLLFLMEIKPILLMVSLGLVALNLYRAYFPKKNAECCTVPIKGMEGVEQIGEDKSKPLTQKENKVLKFLQSKKFLWGVAIVAVAMILYPYVLQLIN